MSTQQRIRNNFALKPIVLYLAFVSFLLASMPADSLAYFVDSQAIDYSREMDMKNIQRVLESKMVSQRLSELGLSMKEISLRIDQLNDSDIHQFASQLDSLMPGKGEVTVTILTILLIVILILVIIQLTGHKIVIK